MALNATALQSALQSLFESLPGTPGEAADGLADAYADYAVQGMFGASTPTVIQPMRDTMAGTLLAAIQAPESGSPATFAGAWATAVAAFWIGVVVAGTQAGTTNGCPGAAALTPALTAVFSNIANTAASCAASLASALHVATQTVTATVTPPAATILPIV